METWFYKWVEEEEEEGKNYKPVDNENFYAVETEIGRRKRRICSATGCSTSHINVCMCRR